MERRTVLGRVGTVLASVLAGCTNSSDDTSKQSFDPRDHVDDWQDERVQGEANPIETEATEESLANIEVRCGRIGKDTLQPVVLARLDETTGLGFGFGRDPKNNRKTDEEDEYVLSVYRTLTVGRDGDVQSVPEVPFSRLREVTPREVHITVRRDGTEIHSCRYEVYVQDQVMYVD